MTPIPTDIEQAYELGRTHERRKMAELEAIVNSAETITRPVSSSHSVTAGMSVQKLETIARRKTRLKPLQSAMVEAAAGSEAQTAPKVARGVKRASGTRTKGVKQGILDLINVQPLTVKEIVAKTGFKEMSIRSVLMALKTKSLAAPDENKRWYGSVEQFQARGESANSETESHSGYYGE